jgi:hypothetical protein
MDNPFINYEDLEEYYRELAARAPNKDMEELWLAKAWDCKNASLELTIEEVENACDNN